MVNLRNIHGIGPVSTNGNGKELTQNERDRLIADIISNQVATSRSEIFRNLMDPRRSIEDECGYPPLEEQISIDLYRELFEREPIAERVVNVLSRECFQTHPDIYEDEDSDKVTEFEEAWDDLETSLQGPKSWHQTEEGSTLWEYLYRVDMLSGIGKFGVLLLGIDDGRNLQDPAEGVIVTNWKKSPVVNRKGEVVDIRYRTEGETLILPDSPLLPSEEKRLLDPKGFVSRTWNQKERKWQERIGPPLSDAEKAIVANWAQEREDRKKLYEEDLAEAQREQAIINARKKAKSKRDRIGQQPVPAATGSPTGSFLGGQDTVQPPQNLRGSTSQSEYLPFRGSSAIYENPDDLQKRQRQQSAQRAAGQSATGLDKEGYSLDESYTAGANPAKDTNQTRLGLSDRQQLSGTDLQYSWQGAPAISSPLAGTDQQYFGIQFGPSEELSEEPAKPGTKLLFLRAFDEYLVQVVRYEWSIRNPRFGMPVMYRVTLNDPREQHSGVGLPMATVFVHWSRVIHVADNLKSSEIFGVPRMRPVLNRLLDIRKLYGGSAEMYWRGAFPGLSLETHPQLGGDVEIDRQGTLDFMEQYMNGLQRYLLVVGMSAKTLSPTVVDPTPQITVQLEAICIELGIPIRVFKGSERGELASSQDDAKWNDRIKHRQNMYLTPRLICPFIDRLITLGILPEPKGYTVKWPDLDSNTDKDLATIAQTKTMALVQYVSGNLESIMQPVDFLVHIMGMNEETANAIVDSAKENEETMTMPPPGESGHPATSPPPPPQFAQGGGGGEDEDKQGEEGGDESSSKAGGKPESEEDAETKAASGAKKADDSEKEPKEE